MSGVTTTLSPSLQRTHFCGPSDTKKLFDGDLNTCNSGDTGAGTGIIAIDFVDKKYVGKIIWHSRPCGSCGGMWGGGNPTTAYVTVFGSNDNSNWTQTGIFGPYTDLHDYKAITVTSNMDTPYRYFKFESKNNQGYKNPHVGELEIYGFDE